jgi:hypothetical protein
MQMHVTSPVNDIRKKCSTENVWPHNDRKTNEWRKLHNVELQGLFQRPNIVRKIVKRKLSWAGYAWRKQDTLVKWVIEEEPNGKRPLGRPKL